MANWKQCTRRDKSRIYLNLDAAIAIRPFDEGFSRVYFAAGAEDDKLYFDVAESAEVLIAPLELRDWSGNVEKPRRACARDALTAHLPASAADE